MPLFGLLVSLASWAMPAKPGKVVMTQPDGTKIETYIRGDECFHYYETLDGKVLMPSTDGTLMYAELDAAGSVVPGSVPATPAVTGVMRGARVAKAAKAADVALLRTALAAQAQKARRSANQPGSIKTKFPTTGTMRGIIILAQYQDVKFTAQSTLEKFQSMAMSDNYQGDNAPGSMREYFVTQSNGQFTPEFDVVGPVTLPHDRKWYGGPTSGNERIADMMVDAADLAMDQCGVDFSKYDANGDGYVDFLYVIYAGHGQAQGGPTESVWPQAMDLSYETWIPDYNGVYLGRIACSCELKGGSGETLDGIGTFCHEFSHILGLPDIYDVDYTSFYGMNHYDIMDRGGYNNDGCTPAGYTAMDKYTVGWLQPTVLEQSETGLQLGDLTETNKAYFLVSQQDRNEYYTLENRQPTKWDAALPGHGLLVSHVSYSQALWNQNRVNTAKAGFEHVQLVAADNKWTDNQNDPNEDGYDPTAEANDVFPGVEGKYTALNDATKPALTWRTGENNQGQGFANISVADDGTVTFDYNTGTTGIRGIEDNAAAADDDAYYTLQGTRAAGTLHKGIYVHGGKKVVVK